MGDERYDTVRYRKWNRMRMQSRRAIDPRYGRVAKTIVMLDGRVVKLTNLRRSQTMTLAGAAERVRRNG